MDGYFDLWPTTGFSVTLLLAMIITGVLSQAINIYRKPTPSKTGFICSVAFFLGSIATYIAK